MDAQRDVKPFSVITMVGIEGGLHGANTSLAKALPFGCGAVGELLENAIDEIQTDGATRIKVDKVIDHRTDHLLYLFKVKRITPHHLQLAIRGNEELNTLITSTIVCGGVILHIYKSVINKTSLLERARASGHEAFGSFWKHLLLDGGYTHRFILLSAFTPSSGGSGGRPMGNTSSRHRGRMLDPPLGTRLMRQFNSAADGGDFWLSSSVGLELRSDEWRQLGTGAGWRARAGLDDGWYEQTLGGSRREQQWRREEGPLAWWR
ncbi:hypothetical protein PR202_gb06474 [Eleusine coracana subsp. coracana]|uniref:Uncharacterized protein n=1 Tax=Eleusine coracana subsp. coracana TaxID=191504 RepID=A0AAV5EAD6_ELECO|nr:hypothetical protein PR202_gb06474 [Eleusine coracana subsp. coracana]